MLLWILCASFGAITIREIVLWMIPYCQGFASSTDLSSLRSFVITLKDIEESLESGLLPDPQLFERLQLHPAPWKQLSYDLIEDLRSSGAPVLPSLRRIRSLAQEHIVFLQEGRTQIAQSFAQALISVFLIPVFGYSLYLLLPALQEMTKEWLSVCLAALFLGVVACLWMLKIAEVARWGGLSQKNRAWLIFSQAGCEYLVQKIRPGLPSDLAWGEMIRFLYVFCPSLPDAWGASLWVQESESGVRDERSLRIQILRFGKNLKKTIHACLIEGKSSVSSVENALSIGQKDFHFRIREELKLVPTQSLKPFVSAHCSCTARFAGYGFTHHIRRGIGCEFIFLK